MKVSIIIPTYNYAQYILEAIESIHKQSYPIELIEVVIIDDGSTDDTPELFKDYTGPLNLRYYWQENKGKAEATQKGIELSTGEIIFNLDADDYFYSEKILQVATIYQKYPEVSHVAHPASILQEGKRDGKEAIPGVLLNQLMKGEALLNYFLSHRILYGGGSTFSGRAAVLKSNPIPAIVDMYIDEYLIYVAAIQGYSYFLEEALSVWRIHGSNYSVGEVKDKKKRSQRLLTSSEGMLQYLLHQSSKKIYSLYELKHLDRYLNYKESIDNKTFNDYLLALRKICSFDYSISDLWRYRIFARLFPKKITKLLKKN